MLVRLADWEGISFKRRRIKSTVGSIPTPYKGARNAPFRSPTLEGDRYAMGFIIIISTKSVIKVFD